MTLATHTDSQGLALAQIARLDRDAARDFQRARQLETAGRFAAADQLRRRATKARLESVELAESHGYR